MDFLLYKIFARIVALWLCVDSYRVVRTALVERRITTINDGWLDWLLSSNWVIARDTAPVSYWVTVGLRVFTMLACLVVAVFGWWRPDA